MPYGKPVSRRRRRQAQSNTTATTAMLAARRLARRAAAAANSSTDAGGSPQAPSSPPSSSGVPTLPAPMASPSLLCAGHRPGVWPLRERLALASSLMDADNQQLTWPTISRRLGKFTPPEKDAGSGGCGPMRPKNWCSARACAKQYTLLLDSAEMFRKQKVIPTPPIRFNMCVLFFHAKSWHF